MLVGFVVADLRICRVNPYRSSLGKEEEVRYTSSANSCAFCQTISFVKSCTGQIYHAMKALPTFLTGD